MGETRLHKEVTEPLLSEADPEAHAEAEDLRIDQDEDGDLFPDLELLVPEGFTLFGVLNETVRLLRRHYKAFLLPSLLPGAQIILSLAVGYWSEHISLISLISVAIVHLLLWCLAATAFPRAIAGAYLKESHGPNPVARERMLLELDAGRFSAAFSRSLRPQIWINLLKYFVSGFGLDATFIPAVCLPYFIAWWPISADCPASLVHDLIWYLPSLVFVESSSLTSTAACVYTRKSVGIFGAYVKGSGWMVLWLSVSTVIPPLVSVLVLMYVDAHYRLAAFVVLVLWRYQWGVCWHVIRTVLYLMCERQVRLQTTLA